jgi:hypothetical protein
MSESLLRWYVPGLLLFYVFLIPYGESNLAIMLIFSIQAMYLLFHHRLSVGPEYRSWLLVTLALCLPLGLSLFTAYRVDTTFISLITFLLHAIAGLYVIDRLKQDPKATVLILGIAVIAGIWVVAALPYQVRNLETTLLQQWIGHLTGDYGKFPNIGNVLAHLSPFYFEALYRLAKKLDRRWPWLLALPLILAIVMSNGRAGWIVLFLVMVFFTIRLVAIGHFTKWQITSGLALVMLAAMISAVTVPQVEQRVTQSLMGLQGGFEAVDHAGSARLQIWQDTVALLPERLLTGHGTRGTGQLLSDLDPAGGFYHRYGSPFGYEHLYWLEVAVGTGIPGLILYLAVFFYLLQLLLRQTNWTSWSFSPMLAAVCILFPLNVHWEFYSSRSGSLMWFLLMVAFAFHMGGRSRQPDVS